MSVQVEKLEKNMAKLTVEVPAEEVEKALQVAYMKEKNKISIPGFRKGKVPRAMIEKMYGAAVFYEEATNILIQDNYHGRLWKRAKRTSFPDQQLTLFRSNPENLSSSQQKWL